MHIESVGILASDVGGALAFWDALGLTVDLKDGAVTIGSSTLRYAHGVPTGAAHLAITIPRNRFADAVRWLESRASLLTRGDQVVFPLPEAPWSSESVYFDGPDGSVLELITRQALPDERDGEFGSADLLEISEIGLVQDDAAAFRGELAEAFGLPPFIEGSDCFQVVGDQHGLLIGVCAGRPWLPTDDREPETAAIDVRIADTPRRGDLTSPLGWRIRSA